MWGARSSILRNDLCISLLSATALIPSCRWPFCNVVSIVFWWGSDYQQYLWWWWWWTLDFSLRIMSHYVQSGKNTSGTVSVPAAELSEHISNLTSSRWTTSFNQTVGVKCSDVIALTRHDVLSLPFKLSLSSSSFLYISGFELLVYPGLFSWLLHIPVSAFLP